ncbi:MAG: asparagine synthase (glutamine-hydrolyzing) [bacterium]
MCGLIGVFKSEGTPDRESLREATRQLIHRGPDEEGFYYENGLGMGFRRLSIIDPAGGSQPMRDRDDTIVVSYNGEIYNSPELRDTLKSKNHSFESHSDTEVLLEAYKEWGSDAFRKFNGMFAFALWDNESRELYLVRDPTGIKSLFYVEDTDGVYYSSEPEPLFELSSCSRELDEMALVQFLHYRFVPSPRTLYRDVKQLKPGEVRCYSDRGVSSELITLEPGRTGCSGQIRDEIIDSALKEAVDRHLLSDVPVGLLLSGGMDSALLLAYVSEVYDRSPTTFTVGFEGDFARDERDLAARTADYYGAEHREVSLGEEEFQEGLFRSVEELQLPVATTSVVPMRKLCQLASSEVKAVLSGQGADEPFGGYRRYFGVRLAQFVLFPSVVGTVASSLGSWIRNDTLIRQGRYLEADRNTSRAFAEIYSVFHPGEIRDLIPDARLQNLEKTLQKPLNDRMQSGISSSDPLGKFLQLDARFQLADDLLGYSDRISMRSSLELRTPYLDHELQKLAFGLPGSSKVSVTGDRKMLLRQAARKRLPDFILNRPKIGFETPYRKFLNGSLGKLFDAKISSNDSLSSHFGFSSKYLDSLSQVKGQGNRRIDRQVFTLLMLELWYEEFV